MRDWAKSSAERRRRAGVSVVNRAVDEQQARRRTLIVDTRPLAPCPAGPLAAAVYVRVGTDAYVSYELFGGL